MFFIRVKATYLPPTQILYTRGSIFLNAIPTNIHIKANIHGLTR